MSPDDKAAPNGLSFDPLTPVTTVTIPEKAALSNTTTACDPSAGKSPRTSKDSTANSVRSNPFETDIEAMGIEDTQPCTSRATTTAAQRRTDRQVWPGKDHWKQKAKSAKMRRSCTCMARMSRRNRIITKIVIAFLVVGVAVGVGFGVSKPLGAPIWGDD